LVLLAACSGGGGGNVSNTAQPAFASALSYQNPGATGFRLVKNTSNSSNTYLELDLIGPSGTQAKGVAFFLEADNAMVTWVHPTGASTTFTVPGNVFPTGSSPQMLMDKVVGSQLQVGIFQKGGSATMLGDAPILSLALELKGTAVPKGTVGFGSPSGKQAVLLNTDASLSNITLNVGTLSAQ
jgi:hypothetical protein